MDSSSLTLILGFVGGLAIAVVSSVVTYKLGARSERERRKASRVDDRLQRIDAAIAHISKGSTSVYAVSGDKGASTDERIVQALQRADSLQDTGAGIIPRGAIAASALGDEKLAATIRAATVLLNTLSRDYEETQFHALVAKLGEAWALYESLRNKLI